jgi:hypothetical protein
LSLPRLLGSQQIAVIDQAALADAIYKFESEHAEHLEMKVGIWNPATREFEETDAMPSTLQLAKERQVRILHCCSRRPT